jgi:hypothetical protein
MRLSDEMSKHWFALPMQLRKRWWTETDYGRKEPSKDLLKEIAAIIAAREEPGCQNNK